MKGLSTEISYALNTIIEGLNYDFFSFDEDDIDIESYVGELDDDKMKTIMKSKVSSFNSAKKILNSWINSPNAPDNETVKYYIEELITSANKAIIILRKALAGAINFKLLEAHKHNSAIEAKPLILESIFDLEEGIRELKEKLESEDLTLGEREFKLGYPERFAKGEFFNYNTYFKNWYDDTHDAVRICPFSTSGEMITLDDLNIVLPSSPKKKKDILFSDLPKKEQYWRRSEQPKGITKENVDEWDYYIKEEFRRRREGIWFMNNGKPVYLTGHHYFALTHCKMLDTGGYMDFRYAQLNMFYHLQACIVDDRCLGQLFVKSRRTGFTYVILSIILNDSTGFRNKNFGLTSKSDNDAQKAFIKYRYMLLNLPFYFIPVIKGKLDSPKSFEFSSPMSASKEYKKSQQNNLDDYLNNFIDYEPTKNDSYDGQKLYRYLGDESGKWKKPNDYIKHFGQISPTMLEGGTVKGKSFIGSTVGAASQGGSQFKDMYDASDINKRNTVTNMTVSGLYRYFLPAQENMEAYTDIYGYCYINKPTVSTKNINGKIIKESSLDFLINQEKDKESKSDTALNEQYRAYPRTIEHAFRDEAEECIFNISKLYEQIEYNDTIPDKDKYIIGNFEWKDEEDGNVIFYPNPNGRFKVSWLPSALDGTVNLANRVSKINDKFAPMNGDIIRFGCDPFSYKSTHGKGSKGGIHGKTMIFPESGVPSNIFAVEYIARPPDDKIFFEDVIKVIRYYSAPILVESNRLDLLRHLRDRGYRKFAMNRLDKTFKELNDNEKEYGGQMMSGSDMIDSHINSIGSWIENYVGISKNDEIRKLGEMGNMVFNETLKDWLKFDPNKRTEYDATISSGLAIMACSTEKYKGRNKKKERLKVVSLFRTYDNSGEIGKINGKFNIIN